eukprot:3077872-Pleurochrysis_carterae.AAC.2
MAREYRAHISGWGLHAHRCAAMRRGITVADGCLLAGAAVAGLGPERSETVRSAAQACTFARLVNVRAAKASLA